MSVNLSPRQFQKESIASLLHVIASSGLDRASLELEITEGILCEDAEETVKIIESLKAAGARVCIDDFGTGYSSLSYLKLFPIDTLKIDRSFVNDIKPGSEALLTLAIVNLAHSMKIDLVAEGVETSAQRDFLLRKGCPVMQGFFFSRPVPAEDVTRLLERQARGSGQRGRRGRLAGYPRERLGAARPPVPLVGRPASGPARLAPPPLARYLLDLTGERVHAGKKAADARSRRTAAGGGDHQASEGRGIGGRVGVRPGRDARLCGPREDRAAPLGGEAAPKAGATLEPSVLVSETFLRLVKQRKSFENRAHLFAVATRVMLRALVDYQRERGSLKRGGGRCASRSTSSSPARGRR